MRKFLELDRDSRLITDLGLKTDKMYELADASKNHELASHLQKSDLNYYRELKDKKELINLSFTGYRRNGFGKSDELFVIYDTVELVYPVERIIFFEPKDDDAVQELIEKEYSVYVSKIDEEQKKVYLSDINEQTHYQVYKMINDEIEAGNDLYLRGTIRGLMHDSGSEKTQTAAYVDVCGKGILGLVTIKNWSVGYTPEEYFRELIDKNRNAIINFKVRGKRTIRVNGRTREVLMLSRADFLKADGYDPWEIAGKKFPVHTKLKVRIIDTGRTANSFYGAIDGIPDLNALCFKDDNSDLLFSDIKCGGCYFGYVQKIDAEKKYFRVRLTGIADKSKQMLKETDKPLTE